jgi:hypothetical protein
MVNAPPPNQEEKRLIILLPSELLEELRQAAEEADLSVSQVVRRAIRNELKSIANANKKAISLEALQEALSRSGYSRLDEHTNADADAPTRILELLRRYFAAAQIDGLSGVAVPGAEPESEGKKRKLADRISTAIAQTKARERK